MGTPFACICVCLCVYFFGVVLTEAGPNPRSPFPLSPGVCLSSSSALSGGGPHCRLVSGGISKLLCVVLQGCAQCTANHHLLASGDLLYVFC